MQVGLIKSLPHVTEGQLQLRPVLAWRLAPGVLIILVSSGFFYICFNSRTVVCSSHPYLSEPCGGTEHKMIRMTPSRTPITDLDSAKKCARQFLQAPWFAKPTEMKMNARFGPNPITP